MKRLFSRVVVVAAVFMASVVAVPVGVAGAATSVAGPVNRDQAFVTAAYNNFLGRDPLPGELASSTAESLVSQSARANVVRKLSKSPEWIRVTVDQMYVDTLGRPGDPGGVDYWVGLITSGRLTVAEVAASLYSSTEYFVGFGSSVVRTWVEDLYTKVLHRPGSDDPSGVNYWVATTASRGRHAVASAFFQSGESCHTRVKKLYETLLNRTPDQGGWDFWAQQVKTQGDLALAANLAASPEYYSRAFSRFGREVPGVPTGVRAITGDGQSVVSWVAPASEGTSPITGYTVTATPGDETCVTTGDLACTVTGLTNDTSYSFSVTATNTVGDSMSSTPVTADEWHILKAPQNPDGTSAGYDAFYALDRSSNGSVVGWGFEAGGARSHALVWPSVDAVPTVLEDDGATQVRPFGISSTGVIVGTVDFQPRVWPSATSAPVAPVVAAGWSPTVGFAGITSDGVIVGSGVDADGLGHGLVWTSPTVTPTSMQSPEGFTQVEPTAVSPSGFVVGSGVDSDGHSHGLVWSSPTAAPTVLSVDPIPSPRAVSSTGIVIGSDAEVWLSPTASPIVLDKGGLVTDVDLPGVSSAGVLAGSGHGGQYPEGTGLLWPSATGQPTVITPPSGYTGVLPWGMTPDGSVVGSVWGSGITATAAVLGQ